MANARTVPPQFAPGGFDDEVHSGEETSVMWHLVPESRVRTIPEYE